MWRFGSRRQEDALLIQVPSHQTRAGASLVVEDAPLPPAAARADFLALLRKTSIAAATPMTKTDAPTAMPMMAPMPKPSLDSSTGGEDGGCGCGASGGGGGRGDGGGGDVTAGGGGDAAAAPVVAVTLIAEVESIAEASLAVDIAPSRVVSALVASDAEA